ncbi:hypothetical protein OT109_17465 [Phycisphaeraceae bacterium D3-23]
MPSRQVELGRFFASLSSKLVADPEGYGLVAAQAAAYQTLQQAYAAALTVALDPATRSPTHIQKKNAARDAAIAETRKLVDIMQAWPGMTNAKRSALGISLRDNVHTRAAIPSSAPKVSVDSVSGRLFNIALRKDDSTSRSKPTGVRAAWVYTAFGDEQPTTFGAFDFRGEARKADTQIVMPESVAPGTKVWVSACWVNTAGKPGPASLPIATWTTHGSIKNNAA